MPASQGDQMFVTLIKENCLHLQEIFGNVAVNAVFMDFVLFIILSFYMAIIVYIIISKSIVLFCWFWYRYKSVSECREGSKIFFIFGV
jgi:hypothetical protein